MTDILERGGLATRVGERRGRDPRPAVFLDRDGVLLHQVHHLCLPSEVRLLPGAAQAVRLLNEAGYLVIVITNQSVVARGLCSIEDLEGIHQLLATLLAMEGARLDAIYYCPHAPADVLEEADQDCDCRKPEIGLVDRACTDFAIDLTRSLMIGDTTVDVETARRAGIVPLLVGTGYGASDGKYSVAGVTFFDDLLSAACGILQASDPLDDMIQAPLAS